MPLDHKPKLIKQLPSAFLLIQQIETLYWKS